MIFLNYRIAILFLLLMLTYMSDAVSANQCKKYQIKYQKIQLLQKKGHSAKKSIALHNKAQKAWEIWNDCKKGKLIKRVNK